MSHEEALSRKAGPFRGRRGPFVGGGDLLQEVGPYAQCASSLEDGAEPALGQHRKASVYHQGQGPRQAVSSQGRGTDKDNHPPPNHLIFFCLSTSYSGVVEEGAESGRRVLLLAGTALSDFLRGTSTKPQVLCGLVFILKPANWLRLLKPRGVS